MFTRQDAEPKRIVEQRYLSEEEEDENPEGEEVFAPYVADHPLSAQETHNDAEREG